MRTNLALRSRNPRIQLSGLVLAITASVLVMSLWTRASVAPASRDALRSTFDAGIRNLRLEWDPNDPRPESARRQALFEFMYETYNATARIPQSLFDSNRITQAVEIGRAHV